MKKQNQRATGRPELEIVFFMRTVHSRTFFEQMKGRGTRVFTPDDLQAVTPDAKAKTHFVIVDAIGLSEEEMVDTRPLERQPSTPFKCSKEAHHDLGPILPRFSDSIAIPCSANSPKVGLEPKLAPE